MANPTPPSPTIAGSTTLQAIRNKVRRLTRLPDAALMPDATLDEYINTFVVYDFPEQLRTFNMRTTFSFWTNPGQDVYNTDIESFAGATNNLLFNFQNKYLTIHPPVFMGGFQSFFTQSESQFYSIYPKINAISSIGVTGNGTPGPFTGVVNSQQSIVPPGVTQNICLLQNNVTFSANGTNAGGIVGMALADVPLVDPATGTKLNIGNLYDVNSAAYQAALKTPPTVVDPLNTINYRTGVFTIQFPYNTIAGQPINSQTVPVPLSLPQAMLFYSNRFVIRPVPDQAYKITFEAYSRPTALLDANQSPELEEYWQYIALGSAKKILQDRMDVETIALLEPELQSQERLCMRRSLVQYANERSFTLYAGQIDNPTGGWNNGFGNNFF